MNDKSWAKLLEQKYQVTIQLDRVRGRLKSLITSKYRPRNRRDNFSTWNSSDSEAEKEESGECSHDISTVIWSPMGCALLVLSRSRGKGVLYRVNEIKREWELYQTIEQQLIAQISQSWVLDNGVWIILTNDGRILRNGIMIWKATWCIDDVLLRMDQLIVIGSGRLVIISLIKEGSVQEWLDVPCITRLIPNQMIDEVALQMEQTMWILNITCSHWTQLKLPPGIIKWWRRITNAIIWILCEDSHQTNSLVSWLVSTKVDTNSPKFIELGHLNNHTKFYYCAKKVITTSNSSTSTSIMNIYNLPRLELNRSLTLPLPIEDLIIPSHSPVFHAAIKLPEDGKWKFIRFED